MNDTFLFESDDDFENFGLFKSKARKTCEEDAVRSGLTSTQAKFKCKEEMGGGILVRGAKKVSLAIPRGATLTLINLNYRAFATRLARAKANEPTKYRDVVRKWVNLGGNEASLIKAMNKGKDKKILICGKKCKEKFDLNFNGVSEDEKAFFDKHPSFEFNNVAGVDDATLGLIITTGGTVLASIGGAIAKTVSSKKEKEADLESLKTEKELKEKQEEERSNQIKFIVIGGAIGLTIIGLSTYLILKNKK